MINFKDFIILNEGGLGGHMDHLYDHWDLTFGELKDLLQAASQGQLEGTEKTDGQNVFITYNIEHRDARAVRNKTNAKNGGLDAAGLAKQFGDVGGGSVRAAFIHAFNMFKKGIEALSDDEIIELFGREGNVFYNAEVIDQRTSNVINYDYNTLLIHRDADYVSVNFHTGELKDGFDPNRSYKLGQALEKMNKVIEGENYQLLADAIRKLNALEDDTALRNTLISISKLGVKDKETIKSYIIRTVNQQIQQSIPNLSPKQRKVLVAKIIGEDDETRWRDLGFDKAPTITQIVKDMDADTKSTVKEAYTNRTLTVKEIIKPLEDTIHQFAVEMLKSLNSTLVIDNKAELQRQRDAVQNAIDNIEGSGHEKAMEVLKIQLAKLENVGNITSAAEGFVFRWNGHTYKFTGNFAPVNQILGMFKYGRSGIDPKDLRAK